MQLGRGIVTPTAEDLATKKSSNSHSAPVKISKNQNHQNDTLIVKTRGFSSAINQRQKTAWSAKQIPITLEEQLQWSDILPLNLGRSNQGKIGVAFSYFLGMHGARCVSLPTAVFFTR